MGGGDGRCLFSILADRRGAYLKGALIQGFAVDVVGLIFQENQLC